MAASMPCPTPRERLQHVLDELVKQDLKRFKAQLNQVPGRPKIKKARLEEADALDTVELMVNTYTMEGALEVCFEVLEAINQRELADTLIGK